MLKQLTIEEYCQDKRLPCFIGTTAAIIGGAVLAAGTVGKAIAEGSAAGAQEKLAREQIRSQQDYRDQVLKNSKPSAEQIKALDFQAKTAETAVANREKLLEAVDPALIEAGKQAVQLMKGQEAQTLDPIRRQRARGRALLESRLRNQLGSGFNTSSAGIEALTRYDQQTDEALSGAQDQALSRLLGSAQQTRQTVNDTDTAALAGTRLAGEGMFQRQTLAGIEAAGRSINENEAKFAGEVQHHKAAAGLFGGIGSLGGQVLGAGLGGGGGDSGMQLPEIGSSFEQQQQQKIGSGPTLGGSYKY